jgi:putative lipoic acid-binding regulatory protein
MNVLDSNTPEKPTIDYPTQWGFKVIGRDKEKLEECIKEAMGKKKHQCKLGNSSKTGKFHSYNTTCSVESEEERNSIFRFFEKHDAVKMVM